MLEEEDIPDNLFYRGISQRAELVITNITCARTMTSQTKNTASSHPLRWLAFQGLMNRLHQDVEELVLVMFSTIQRCIWKMLFFLDQWCSFHFTIPINCTLAFADPIPPARFCQDKWTLLPAFLTYTSLGLYFCICKLAFCQ